MGSIKTFYEFTVAGFKVSITYSVVIEWIVMFFLIVLTLLLTSNFKTVPGKVQNYVEILVESINNLVKNNMGEEYIQYAPFIGTIAIYMLIFNLFGFTGLVPPTTDYSVALGFALLSFIVIHGTAIKKNGIIHYFEGYVKPFVLLLPLNIIERLIVPVSLSLRLFGNITAAMIMVDLFYRALEALSKAIHIRIPLFDVVIPIPFHIYFDLFDGIIQMFIFIMLTMIFIKTTTEH